MGPGYQFANLRRKLVNLGQEYMRKITTRSQREAVLRKLANSDHDKLVAYLNGLSQETKSRFGPHPFDLTSVQSFYQNNTHLGFIAQEPGKQDIVAYSIIKVGFLDFDRDRLQSYGLELHPHTDATYAPSVADKWQTDGLGNALFQFILSDLEQLGIKRILLWGGVQSGNEKAVRFYLRNGFQVLGEFHHNGQNYDMMLQIG